MSSINSLEKRINALELQILPHNRDTSTDSQSITDLLLQTQIMIKSALSCREAITSILQHTLEINEYLNPSHKSDQVDSTRKSQYLLELYPEIRQTIQIISSFEKLVPFIDSSQISKVPLLKEKLEQLSIKSLSDYDESKYVTMRVLKSLQQYSDITNSVKLLFGSLEKVISELEEIAKTKFIATE